MAVCEVDLKVVEMHWLEEGDPHDDCCVHGRVYLKLGDRIVSSGDEEWTLSTAAFRLLATISVSHARNIDNALVPCCGFTMWRIESEPDGLYIPNCNSGIDWTINHPESDVVEHVFSDGETLLTNLCEWSTAVSQFSDQVRDFFQTAWPKNFYDDDSRLGFELFMSLWRERRELAEKINAGSDCN